MKMGSKGSKKGNQMDLMSGFTETEMGKKVAEEFKKELRKIHVEYEK